MERFDPFAPAAIGSLSVPNHFVRSATYMGLADDRGAPTAETERVWCALADGGVGTIITSYTHIASYEQPRPHHLGMQDDALIGVYRPIVEAVHAHGARIVSQLVHGSSWGQADPVHARILGPSALPHPDSGLVPREMTVDDIHAVTQLFAEAACRAKAAGFDGVQIHSAHDYLLSQFISPLRNRRADAYGGSVENRFRFLNEVYRAVRDAVGDFPVWVKINSSDEEPGGLTEDDFCYMATCLAREGIDAIEVSGNRWAAHTRDDRRYYFEPARRLAEEVDTPVILTGGLRTRADIDYVAANSRIRLFGFSRPLLRDPAFVQTLRK
ncbi:MAG: NADH:flavin oxidoreductase [Eggerthellaceae bacterium]|jgi:2,4-dienoyl-CoA reductase-like NADH-dependent reductase (Old Yellow Enzyme family)